MFGNVAVVVIEIASLIVRGGPHNPDVLPWGLILSVVVTLLLLYTGWLGGKLVFRLHTGISDEQNIG